MSLWVYATGKGEDGDETQALDPLQLKLTGSCELSNVGWEPNSDPLEEHFDASLSSLWNLLKLVWGTEFILYICISDAERKSLYTLFLESIQLRLQHGEDSAPHIVNEDQTTKENLIKMQSIAERHFELDDIHDPLLAINFARW